MIKPTLLVLSAGMASRYGSRKQMDGVGPCGEAILDYSLYDAYQAGFETAVISASNDLDEFLIHDLKIQGAKITSWGVGTNLITSKDCPSFGGVYKLAAIQQPDGSFVSARFRTA